MPKLQLMSGIQMPRDSKLVAGSALAFKVAGLGVDKKHLVIKCDVKGVTVLVIKADLKNSEQTLRLESDSKVATAQWGKLTAHLASDSKKIEAGLIVRIMLCVAWLAVGACAGDSFPSELDPKPQKRIQPTQDEYYGPPEPAIKRLLLESSKNIQVNHFCVVGYAYASNNVNVWVHWREAQELMLWRDSSDAEARENGLLTARRTLRLGRDTVERRDEIKGSTYLVTRAWWQAIVDDCAEHGEQFTIAPFSGQPPGAVAP